MAKSPAELQSLIRSHCPQAIRVLQGIMGDKTAPPSVRAKCAEVFVSRGIPQDVRVSGDEQKPIRLIDDRELARKLLLVLSRAQETPGDKAKVIDHAPASPIEAPKQPKEAIPAKPLINNDSAG